MSFLGAIGSSVQQVSDALLRPADAGGFSPTTKTDLADIKRDYQVPDDQVIDYHPRAFGWFDIPFTDSVKVTATEGKLLDTLTFDRGLSGLSDFKDLRSDVFAEAESRYPDPASTPSGIPADRRDEWLGNDGHRDAFRHAYWNARMTKEYGEDWSKQFATAHEGLPGNPATREAMDLYNNEVGRQIAVANPDATDEQLANLVQQAVTDGKLIVIDSGGALAWSNDVPYGEHGLSGSEELPGNIPRPDGEASTSS